ncbi:MAG: type II toxin-antitoxin system RelE/ParE family toxin [Desulfovibrionaceae bacterium]|nr:type II toxin-antitoxin system RelE/ParE family toxin [Desulfovibrionaceae bacterium]
MNILRRTEQFMLWYSELKDIAAKSRIAARLKHATQGNFGDHKSVGRGVMEMRIHAGPGYRLYYAQAGNTVYVLLLGGSKRTQVADIQEAHALWERLQEGSK